MAIKRQGNWLGSMRVDIPHLRAMESAVAADFQALSGTLMAGSRALVAYGAKLIDSGMVGQPASNLFVVMVDAVLLHAQSAELGGVFTVDAGTPNDQLVGTNPNVVGTFTAGVVNYISVDLVRATDDTTTALTVFRSSTTGAEFTQAVPQSRSLRYKLHIDTNNFAATPTRAPIAKVTVGATGNITAIEDCRQMYWRLGTGGSAPAPLAYYTGWGTDRDENSGTSKFEKGDKDIRSQYDWNRAVMTRLWELGGGEHWYSALDGDRSVRIIYDPLAVLGSGTNWDWNAGTSTLSWAGVKFLFTNATGTVNEVADSSAVLADGDVVYVDLDPSQDLTGGAAVVPVKVNQQDLKLTPPTRPGSRHILAWAKTVAAVLRIYVNGQGGTTVNTTVAPATNTTLGIVQLWSTFLPDPPNPVVPVMNSASGAGPGQVVARGMVRDAVGQLLFEQSTMTATAASGADGVTGVGDGAGSGVDGSGGTTDGSYGGDFSSLAANGHGVRGTGTGTGVGVTGESPTNNGTGVKGTGSYGVEGYGGGAGADAVGVYGEGKGTSAGVYGASGLTDGSIGVQGISRATNGPGVKGTGTGNREGVWGIGGTTSGAGVIGQGGATNGQGGYFQGTGAGEGVRAVGGATHGIGINAFGGNRTGAGYGGTGIVAEGGDGDGAVIGSFGGTGVFGQGGLPSSGLAALGGTGVIGVGGGSNGAGTYGGVGGSFEGGPGRAPLHVTVLAADPTILSDGDIWINSTTSQLCFRVGGATIKVP